VSTGYWSREQRLARLGPEMYELGLKAAAEAPPPTPAQVELIGRIFAPHVKRLAERDAQTPRAQRAA
jgi:hypothetical protein